jgi:hypothetical protein
MPIGVVSNAYKLAQHTEVVEGCLEGLRPHGIDPQSLRCEVGLTPLGEWMNFRAYFPSSFDQKPKDGNALALRLECFNSVDGSSRLVILLGWYRCICTNGLIIGESKAELSDSHNKNLNLSVIPSLISEGLTRVAADIIRLKQWEESPLNLLVFKDWVDTKLADTWGKKAACRTLHICNTGCDVEITNPFADGKASEKPIKLLDPVPGAAGASTNLYDVCQALSWIATHRNNAEERLEWQTIIPDLIQDLMRYQEAA